MEDENLNDPFWLNDYKILFYKEKLTEFFPTMQMTLIEKLNAIFRMSIYLSILLYLLTNNYLYLYIMIIVGAFTIFINTTQKDNMEMYFNSVPEDIENEIQNNIINENITYVQPTVENHFMNINLITDHKEKEKAPPSWNNEKVQEKIITFHEKKDLLCTSMLHELEYIVEKKRLDKIMTSLPSYDP